MILKIKGRQRPTKKSLKEGEGVVIEHKAAQYSPEEKAGKFLYLRVGDSLLRTKLEEVEWRE